MSKKSRARRRARNRDNPFGSSAYQKWDAENQRWYWAAGKYDSKADNGRGKWVERPKNWAPTAPLYFAYGSNLNVGQMLRRAPEARPFSKLVLQDWQLVFRGVADIEPKPGCSVQGGLWRITGADEAALDRYEGVRSGLYGKHYFTVSYKDDGGNDVIEDVLVYIIATEDRGLLAPAQFYLDTIREGFKDFRLDETSLDTAVAQAPPRPPPVAYSYGFYEGYGRTWGQPTPGAWSKPTDDHDKGEDAAFKSMYPSKAEREAADQKDAAKVVFDDADSHEFWAEYERWLTGSDGYSGGS